MSVAAPRSELIAAIFLRNGDRHLDGVAILVLLVRCSGTQWYAVVRVFLVYMDIVALKFANSPGPARGRGGWQWRSLRPLALPSFHAVHQALSLGPCTVTVNGAAGHNRWGVVERRLPAKTQGRTVDCSFNSVGCPLSPAGRHHARCSCEEKYSRVKATDPREVLAGQST